MFKWLCNLLVAAAFGVLLQVRLWNWQFVFHPCKSHWNSVSWVDLSTSVCNSVMFSGTCQLCYSPNVAKLNCCQVRHDRCWRDFISTFLSGILGTTRDSFEGKAVERLEYEAYNPMVEKELKKVCDRIRKKWSIRHICIMHRLGWVRSVSRSGQLVGHSSQETGCIQFLVESLFTLITLYVWPTFSQNICLFYFISGIVKNRQTVITDAIGCNTTSADCVSKVNCSEILNTLTTSMLWNVWKSFSLSSLKG